MTWRIELLGGLRVRRGSRSLARLTPRNSAALLAYLACYLERPHSRAELADLLWPSAAPRRALGNLSGELYRLRRQLLSLLPDVQAGDDCLPLAADAERVWLDPERVATDVAAFRAAYRSASRLPDGEECAAALASVVEMYRGPLLPEMYEEWVVGEREHLAQVQYLALSRLLRHLERAGAWEEGIERARQGVMLDPLREEMQRELIRVLGAAGRPEAARRQYRELERLLREELNAAPEAATRALVHEIERRKGNASTVLLVPGAQAGPRRSEAGEPLPPARAAPHDRQQAPRLPRPLTRFIGREREVREVRELLAAHRLVTLTGAGGCGKTRLALQVAAGIAETDGGPRDGARLVDLAPLADPELVPRAVAAALGVAEEPDAPILQTVIAVLRDRELLLLLDNCEHLAEASARLAETLLQACPCLKILATSRERLGIGGEQVYRVPSLSLPPAETGASPEAEAGRAAPLPAVLASEAGALFYDRALALSPRFAVTAANAASVAAICRRLDGIPLAIELAAARMNLLSAEQIAARLDDLFRLLTAGSRTALPRQQTLRASIDWSHDLLSPRERAFFRRLAVFAGGWSLEAAEQICDPDALDLLTRLVDRSLVLLQETPAEPRYRLLEPIREYAWEQLRAAGEETELRLRHRDGFLALAEQASPHLEGPDLKQWLNRLGPEQDNFRAALAWSAEAGELAPALRLASALAPFWGRRGHREEGKRWLMTLLDRFATGDELSESDARIRARALREAAGLHVVRYDGHRSRALIEESLALWRRLGDPAGTADALTWLAEICAEEHDDEAGQSACDEALALWQRLDDARGIEFARSVQGTLAFRRSDWVTARRIDEELLAARRARQDWPRVASCLTSLANVAFFQGDLETAAARGDEGLAILRDVGDIATITLWLHFQAILAHLRGDDAQARALEEEGIARLRQMGYRGSVGVRLNALGGVALLQGDFDTARRCHEEALALGRELRSQEIVAGAATGLARLADAREQWERARALYAEGLSILQEIRRPRGWQAESSCREIALCLEGLGWSAALQGEWERGARLFGAAQALREQNGVRTPPSARAGYERRVAALRAALGKAAFAAAWAAGRTLPVEHAIAEALTQAQPAATEGAS